MPQELSDSVQHLVNSLIGFGFIVAAGLAAAAIAMTLVSLTKVFK